jgi:hypothetical protein
MKKMADIFYVSKRKNLKPIKINNSILGACLSGRPVYCQAEKICEFFGLTSSSISSGLK